MIKNIIFDFGGVIITLDQQKAVRRFVSLGIKDAAERLDQYTQGGIFGALEEGKLTAEEFRQELSALAGHDISVDECRDAWVAYCKELPQRNIEKLKELRERGYRLILLSNTNPYMMSWAESADFDGAGHGVSHYFDALYKSFEVGLMKPDPQFFRHVIDSENIDPAESLFVDDGTRNVAVAETFGLHTFCPANGADWTHEIEEHLQ